MVKMINSKVSGSTTIFQLKLMLRKYWTLNWMTMTTTIPKSESSVESHVDAILEKLHDEAVATIEEEKVDRALDKVMDDHDKAEAESKAEAKADEKEAEIAANTEAFQKYLELAENEAKLKVIEEEKEKESRSKTSTQERTERDKSS